MLFVWLVGNKRRNFLFELSNPSLFQLSKLSVRCPVCPECLICFVAFGKLNDDAQIWKAFVARSFVLLQSSKSKRSSQPAKNYNRISFHKSSSPKRNLSLSFILSKSTRQLDKAIWNVKQETFFKHINTITHRLISSAKQPRASV